jgi:hypothetical protein
MINHVVLFKLKKYSSEAQKQAALDTFKSKLLALKNSIPELKYIEVGLHHELETVTYDLCLITHFENLNDLETYRVHPEHQKVVEFVKEHAELRAVVDFEF